jgi:hypothetical protein
MSAATKRIVTQRGYKYRQRTELDPMPTSRVRRRVGCANPSGGSRAPRGGVVAAESVLADSGAGRLFLGRVVAVPTVSAGAGGRGAAFALARVQEAPSGGSAGSSAIEISPPSPSRSSATSAHTITPMPHAPRPRQARIGSRTGRVVYEQTLPQGQTVRFGLRKPLWIRLGAPRNLDATIGRRPLTAALPSRTSDILITATGLQPTA